MVSNLGHNWVSDTTKEVWESTGHCEKCGCLATSMEANQACHIYTNIK